MTRKPHSSDFEVKVPGVGTFVFGRRKMADEIQIQVEFARLIDGVEPTEWLSLVAGWLSTLRVLTVRAPADWNIDEMDPLDDDTYAKLALVHSLLSQKERSFRGGNAARSEGDGAASGQDGGVLVSPEVRPDGA